MSLEEELGKILVSKNLTISLAESITGGLISNLITNVPGSSRYFLASLVCYSYESKTAVLGVKESTLRNHGAVSEQVAIEMAMGARRVTGSNISGAVTGIAGPGGATPTKPIGLVCFAIDNGSKVIAERKNFSGSREEIKRRTAEHLMKMIIDSVR